MNVNSGYPLLLDVPYYQQTNTATCGPACLMMVMKYYHPYLEFSQKLEYSLWRKSYSLFLFGGTFQFGLAVAAASHGLKAEIYQHGRFSEGYTRVPNVAMLVERIVSSRARQASIPIIYGTDHRKILRDALLRCIPPLVFVNLQPIIGENVFHWVVVTGLDERTVYVNDPYVPRGWPQKQKKDSPVSLDIFSQAMATGSGRGLRLPPCVLIVHTQNDQKTDCVVH